MKNKYLVAVLCVLVATLCVISACGGGNTASSSPNGAKTTTEGDSIADLLSLGLDAGNVRYDLTITMTGQEPVKMTIYKKGNKMRQVMSMSGFEMVSIIDGDAQKMYTLMESTKTASEMPYTAGMMAGFTWEKANDILKYSPDKLGTESIDGKSCTIVGWKSGESSVKYWIWKEKGIPLKIESTFGGTTTTMAYTNVDLSNIPDSMFQVPEDYEIISF